MINITEQRLSDNWWDLEFEKDEMLFCKVFLNEYSCAAEPQFRWSYHEVGISGMRGR